MHHRQFPMAAGELLQHFDGLRCLARPPQRIGAAQFRSVIGGAIGRQRLILGNRQIMLAEVFQKAGRQQKRIDMIGAQIARDARVEQHIIVPRRLVAQHGGEGEKHLGHTRLGVGHMAEGGRGLLLQGLDQPRDFGIGICAKAVREHGQCIVAAPQLAKDLGMGHDPAPGLARSARRTTVKDRLCPFEVTHTRQREGLVIHHKALHPGLFAQPVKCGHGGGDIACAHMRPSLHQPADPRADGRCVPL